MKLHKLDSMLKGWFVGDFDPVALPSKEVEVAIKYYRAGDKESAHFHMISTELTVVVYGRILMLGQELGQGDIITVEPGEATSFEALTDASTVVVKIPSVTADKFVLKVD